MDLSKYTTTTKSTTATKVVVESVLTLTNIDSSDFASYQCIAGNIAGQTTQEEVLNVHCEFDTILSLSYFFENLFYK